MKYETIDAHQVDDLMEKREVRPPADWKDDQPSSSTKGDDNNGSTESQSESDVSRNKADPSIDNPENAPAK